MKKKTQIIISIFLLFLTCSKTFAGIYYVSKTGSHSSPFTSWATAATNIQTAVNSSSDGDTVLVNDGTYYPSSEIFVAKNIIVKSVNGAENTIVDGNNINRCFYLFSANPTIDGFTITNGYTSEWHGGGGVYCYDSGTIQNSTISGNSTRFNGGGVLCNRGGTIQNSTISGNSAKFNGGGVRYNHGGTIQNSTISQNSADWGGGIFGGTISNCIISRNCGGGICNSIINNCTITMNSAGLGAGAFYGTVNNCIITKNSADTRGGGTCYAIVNNCTIIGNTAWNGSATAHSTVNNCIVWNNIAYNYGNNFCDSKIKYSCSAALSGEGNISNNPEFVDIKSGNYHLKVNSSCINAGTNAFAPMPYDLDGNSRVFDNIVDMGAYEYPVR